MGGAVFLIEACISPSGMVLVWIFMFKRWCYWCTKQEGHRRVVKDSVCGDIRVDWYCISGIAYGVVPVPITCAKPRLASS